MYEYKRYFNLFVVHVLVSFESLSLKKEAKVSSLLIMYSTNRFAEPPFYI